MNVLPVVTVDDSIGVEHGNNLEDEVISQIIRSKIVGGEEKVYETFHHERGNCLTWVDSR